MTAYLAMSFLTSRTSALCTSTGLRKRRLRLADFFSSRWLFIARRRSTLPVPVSLNRFFVALCVFCFGIVSRSSCVLGRTQHHHHVPAVEQGRGLYLPDLLHVLRQPHQQIAAAL